MVAKPEVLECLSRETVAYYDQKRDWAARVGFLIGIYRVFEGIPELEKVEICISHKANRANTVRALNTGRLEKSHPELARPGALVACISNLSREGFAAAKMRLALTVQALSEFFSPIGEGLFVLHRHEVVGGLEVLVDPAIKSFTMELRKKLLSDSKTPVAAVRIRPLAQR